MTADEWLNWPPLTPSDAEVDQLLHALCHAALHDGRGGRVGLPGMWKAVLGVRS